MYMIIQERIEAKRILILYYNRSLIEMALLIIKYKSIASMFNKILWIVLIWIEVKKSVIKIVSSEIK